MIVAYLCNCKPWKHYNPRYIQGNKVLILPWFLIMCFNWNRNLRNIYIPVRALLVCSKNMHIASLFKDLSGHSMKLKGDQIFTYSGFLFTVMKEKLLEFFFCVSVRKIVCFCVKWSRVTYVFNDPFTEKHFYLNLLVINSILLWVAIQVLLGP